MRKPDPEKLEKLREFLTASVVKARGEWDARFAMDTLCDCEWLWLAMDYIGTGLSIDAEADALFDEIEAEHNAAKGGADGHGS